MEWHFTSGDLRNGPVSEESMKQLIQEGVIAQDDLVWQPGFAEWLKASDVAQFSRLFRPPSLRHQPAQADAVSPATDSGDASDNRATDSPKQEKACSPPVLDSASKSCPECGLIHPHSSIRCECGFDFKSSVSSVLFQARVQSPARPWVRYWARWIDLAIFGLFVGFCLALIAPDVLEMNNAAFTFLLCLCWIPAEALFLASVGSTPGKWLLRISLACRDHDSISIGRALGRAANVWARGMGIGIPLISMVTMIVAYRTLKNSGRTSWDERGDFIVSHETIGIPRTSFAILIGVCMIALGVAGAE